MFRCDSFAPIGVETAGAEGAVAPPTWRVRGQCPCNFGTFALFHKHFKILLGISSKLSGRNPKRNLNLGVDSFWTKVHGGVLAPSTLKSFLRHCSHVSQSQCRGLEGSKPGSVPHSLIPPGATCSFSQEMALPPPYHARWVTGVLVPCDGLALER